MAQSDESATNGDTRFTFGVRELEEAQSTPRVTLEIAPPEAPLKAMDESRGFDPYNTSGSFDRKNNWTPGRASAERRRTRYSRRGVAIAAVRRAEFTVGIPARKSARARHAIADCIVKRQIVDGAAHVPILAILVARLAIAVRHVVVDLRPAPYWARAPNHRGPRSRTAPARRAARNCIGPSESTGPARDAARVATRGPATAPHARTYSSSSELPAPNTMTSRVRPPMCKPSKLSTAAVRLSGNTGFST